MRTIVVLFDVILAETLDEKFNYAISRTMTPERIECCTFSQYCFSSELDDGNILSSEMALKTDRDNPRACSGNAMYNGTKGERRRALNALFEAPERTDDFCVSSSQK